MPQVICYTGFKAAAGFSASLAHLTSCGSTSKIAPKLGLAYILV